MDNATSAAIVVAGTAAVLAPIPTKAVRDLTGNLALPEPAPAPEPEPTPVLTYDNHGSYWGASTIDNVEIDIDQAQLFGQRVDEWHVTDRHGQPLRIVRLADPDFLDTICVIPA
ncbi:hypothetical protein ACF07S_10295 [Streptomyces sp. NPDC016640]|uniref:hypothetical protein n=1 Tax=Streptomyces sp. NPDC016640 TaxID=3364969 RepID=UPI0036FC1050